jgi:hypothetical protein
MNSHIVDALIPFSWENCGELGYCVDTIVGRYWVVPEAGKYRAQLVYMEHERAEQKYLNDGSDEKSAREAAWLHYVGMMSRAFTVDGSPAPKPIEEVEADDAIVAYMTIWANGEPEVATSADRLIRGSEKSKVTALTLKANGDVVAWRWTDGGGYNADFRYSFVDPRDDEEEVEASGASCVGKCEELYLTKVD